MRVLLLTLILASTALAQQPLPPPNLNQEQAASYAASMEKMRKRVQAAQEQIDRLNQLHRNLVEETNRVNAQQENQ